MTISNYSYKINSYKIKELIVNLKKLMQLKILDKHDKKKAIVHFFNF